jgi:hypothetical protein
MRVLDADVNKLCIRIMKKLKEKTQNDEVISVDGNTFQRGTCWIYWSRCL